MGGSSENGGDSPPHPGTLGGEHLPPKTPTQMGGTLGKMGGLFGAWGGAVTSLVFEAFLKKCAAPPHSGGEQIADFGVLRHKWGGLCSKIVQMGGSFWSLGGSTSRIFQNENFDGSPPQWGGAWGGAFGALGGDGGEHSPPSGKGQ